MKSFKILLFAVIILCIHSVVYSQSITVTSPNGGENWVKGTTRNITWISSGVTAGTFTVRLFDGTTSIGIIQAGIPCTDGVHSIPWIVGNLSGGGTASSGSNFKIKVRQASLAPKDFSNAPFTISSVVGPTESITVTSPNGGESWQKGTSHNITWTSSGITTGTFTVLLFDGTTNIGTIQTGIPCTDGVHSIPWIVGNLAGGGTASSGSNFKIKVKQTSLAPKDFSDATFIITDLPTSSIFNIKDKRTLSLIAEMARKADLKVINVTITPDKPRARKDMITIKVTVKNVGNATPSRRCSLTMSIWSVDQNGMRITPGDRNNNAIPWYTNNIPQLNPGDQIEISKIITLRYEGRHMVNGVIITEGLQQGEEKAGNNDYKEYFMAYGPPKKADLVLTKVAVTSNGQIKLRMCNKGYSIPDVDYNTCSYVKIVIGSESKSIHFRDIDPSGILKKGRRNFGGWLGGSVTYFNYIWPGSGYNGIKLEQGRSYNVEVILDYNCRISDSNRSNNKKTVTLSY